MEEVDGSASPRGAVESGDPQVPGVPALPDDAGAEVGITRGLGEGPGGAGLPEEPLMEVQGHFRSVSPGTSGPRPNQEMTGSGEAESMEGLALAAGQQSAGWGESQMGVLQGQVWCQ